jgi:hypothetical protein
MSSNKNGLISTKQVAGSANTVDSSYFVLQNDTVYIDSLIADEIITNTLTSGVVDVNTNIQLNGSTLDVSGGLLQVNGNGLATQAFAEQIALDDAKLWATFKATQNVDMSNNKITNLGTPTNTNDATSKQYVDNNISTWSTRRATSTVNISGFTIDNAGTINARDISNAGITLATTRALGQGFPALTVTGGSGAPDLSNTGVHCFIRKNVRSGATNEPLTQINFAGLTSTEASRLFGYISQTSVNSTNNNETGLMSFAERRNGNLTEYLIIDGSNNTVRVNSGGLDVNNLQIRNVATPLLPTDAVNKQYVDSSSTGGGSEWATFKATQNVDMSNNKITNLGTPTNTNDATSKQYVDNSVSTWSANKATQNVDMSNNKITNLGTPTNTNDATTKQYVDNSVSAWSTKKATSNLDMDEYNIIDANNILTSDELNISANDLNLSATGLLSFLNINSVAATAITAGGGIFINAIGAVEIAGGGIVSIGSANYTTIENLNIDNSVITKVGGTDDLQLNNIGSISNSSANISIQGNTSVDVESFRFTGNVITKAGSSDIKIQNISELNTSTPGQGIFTKNQIVNGDLEMMGGYGSFISQNIKVPLEGQVISFYSSNIESTTDEAIGLLVYDTSGVDSKGIHIKNLRSQSLAYGVELEGTLIGQDKRGIYEHFDTSGVINTFTNPVGIGCDPSGIQLDISGRCKVSSTEGGIANPTMTLEIQNDGTTGAFLTVNKVTASPAPNDFIGGINFTSNDTSGAIVQYARNRTLIQDATSSSHNGSQTLAVARQGLTTNYIQLNGASGELVINPDKVSNLAFVMYDGSGGLNDRMIYAHPTLGISFKGYPKEFIFDISGEYTLTLPAPGFTRMMLVCAGAGGGSGSTAWYPSTSQAVFGSGGGSGGNAVEQYFSRQELFPDTSGDITFYITVGKGGEPGQPTLTPDTPGNNGGNGGITSVALDVGRTAVLQFNVNGGIGSAGSSTSSGNGASPASFSGNPSSGSSYGCIGRPGANSITTGQPFASTSGNILVGTQTFACCGGAAGAGLSASNVAYAGGSSTSACLQYFGSNSTNGLFPVLDVPVAGTLSTPGNNGSRVQFTKIANAKVRPLKTGSDVTSGGSSTPSSSHPGGIGFSHIIGQPGSRGGGGSGSGASRFSSTPGARGHDGFVYLVVF